MDVEQPRAPSPPPLVWSTYFNDSSPDSFLIHTTSDGLLLSLPRFILQAASHVFEDLLTGSRLHDVKGTDLEWALRLAHRDHVAGATNDLRGYGRLLRAGPEAVAEIYRILIIADKFGLNGIVPSLVDTFSQSHGNPLLENFLEVLVVAIATSNVKLVNLALKRWAADEIKSVYERDENGAAQIEVSGKPPDWSDFEFDCTSIRHSDKPFPDLSTRKQFEPFNTREAEEGEVRTIWRWRPRHISDLEDFYLDLFPNDVLRLLLREETRVNHSFAYSWNESAYAFERKWRELHSFRT